ncbi:MAG TPA: protein translocase subunit SecF [Steroidobacteraceae bacterium]|nr:protein translocase subunit SecF [Steroidobacteraceae bacterium]
MEFFKKVPTLHFMRLRRRWYGLSLLMVLATVVSLIVHGLHLSIDFTGGVEVELSFSAPANVEQIQSTLVASGFKEPQVQLVDSVRDVLVRLPPQGETVKGTEVGKRIETALAAIDPKVRMHRADSVGSQVGRELAENGALALVFTFLLIGLYVSIRFHTWRLGTGAVVASMHNPIVVIGFFSVTGLTFDLPALAAVLAVIGHSLNDTVVVFDRIRENFERSRRAASADLIDAAINQTLSRTVITSGATFVVVLMLLLFGGEALRGFSVALLVGIVVVTYSSIYVASSLALDMGLTGNDLFPQRKSADELDKMP